MKKLISLLLTSLLTISCLPSAALAADDGTLANWSLNRNGIDASYVRVVLDSSESYVGSSSARLSYDLPTQANRYALFETQISGVQKGKTYKYGLAAKAKGAAGCRLMINWTNNTSILALGKDFDWTEFNFKYTHTADTTSRNLQFLIENITESIWLDKVYFCEVLEDGSLGPNLITNSSFDAGEAVRVETEETKKVNELESLFNQIKTQEEFTLDDIKKVIGGFKYAPVYQAEGINVDGVIDEWEGYPQFGLPTKSTQYHVYRQNDPRDNTGYCQYAYDDEYFYLAISVTDNILFTNNTFANYWQGDSIQLAMCDTDEVYDAEIGFSHNPNGEPTIGSTNYGEESLKKIQLKTSYENNEIIYEAAIPWSLKYTDGVLPKGFLFDVIINDNDGSGRAYCIELAPGIAEGKSSAEFPYLEFCQGKADWYGWLEGEDTITITDNAVYEFYLVNEGEERQVTVSIPLLDIEEKVTIPAKSGIRRAYNVHFDEKGKYNIAASISDGTKTLESAKEITVLPTPESYVGMMETLKGYASELDALIKACEEQGITPDYEIVHYSVINRYANDFELVNSGTNVAYMQRDIDAGNFDRVEFNFESLTRLYNEAKANLEAYLAGEKDPLPVTRFVQSPTRTEGTTVYTTTDTEGVIAERPFFFTGFGHFEGVLRDIPNLQDFGFSIIQSSIEPTYALKYGGSDANPFVPVRDWYINRWTDYYESAVDSNVKVDLLLGLHAAPSFVGTTWTDWFGKSAADVIVKQGAILIHPMQKAMVKAHVKEIFEQVGDIESINSICLSNEPTTNTNSTYYKPYWAQYITEIYDADINKLNEAYGTDYKSFMDVPMQDVPSYNRHFYDWKMFNDKILTEYHKFIVECIREYDPDIPVHSKMMSMGMDMDDSRVNFLTYGTQHELFSEFSGYNGSDAYGYIHDQHWSLREMEFFYDQQTSMNDAPCFNSEDHMIPDGSKELNPMVADFVGAKMWQSFIHGLGLSTAWEWRFTTDKNDWGYGLMLSNPDALARMGTTTFDANRLAYEIQAIQQEEPSVALLMSYKTRIWNRTYSNAQYKVYENCLANGQKVEFIIEEQIDRIHDYDLVVVPSLTHVAPETLAAIKKYADEGGRIIIFDENSLKKNHINEPHDESIVNSIREKSECYEMVADGHIVTSPTNDEFYDILHKNFDEMGINRVEIIDVETGTNAKNIEFEYTEYNGNIVLNLINFDESSSRNVKIMVDGKEAKNLFDLRADEQMASGTFELKTYVPKFIRIGDNASAPVVNNEINVTINGEKFSFPDAKPFIDERDRTLVPLRFVSEALEADVAWDGETKTVTVTKGEDVITYTVGEMKATKNGKEIAFDTYGIIKEDRTFVPVRYISELLDCSVDWDSVTKTVIIN